MQAVALICRSTVMMGIFLAVACWSTGSQPSELSGAMTSALAPWAMSCWTSLICLPNCDWALVLRSLDTPIFLASALIEPVSAMRKGLASFSDWEKPITALLGSNFSPPNLPSVQVGPAAAEDWTTCCWPSASWPPADPASSSDLAQPDTASVTAAQIAMADLSEAPGLGA